MTTPADSAARIRRLQDQMARHGVDLVAIAPTVNLRYLLGFSPFADERPCFLLVSSTMAWQVVPAVNAAQFEARTTLPLVRWPDAEGPRQAITQSLAALGLGPGITLAIDNAMRADFLLLLQEVAEPARCVPGDLLMGALRICKSGAEVEALARSAALADGALLAGADACRPGATEREVAEACSAYFRSHGADTVDFCLIASGPHGAFPHHETGPRRLEAGDTIVLDMGATLDGYKSDITRTVCLGEPPAEVRSAYEAVRKANEAGRRAAVAGARARDVDRVTRGILEEAGYGPYFVHRTGHGLGMELHEPPWITSECDTVLEPGMVFSVEPGVYLPGRFGIRIEDIVVVQPEGECRRLTGLGHELIVRG